MGYMLHSSTSHLCIKCVEFFALKLLGAKIERLKDQMKLFNDIIGKHIRNRHGLIKAFSIASKQNQSDKKHP